MKTKEFLKILETCDYDLGITIDIDRLNKYVEIKNFYFNVFIKLDERYYYINMANKTLPKDLFDLIHEYVNTPLEEREEEKKYHLRLKGIVDNGAYLNHSESENGFLINTEEESMFHKTIFTQAEIDDLPDEIKQHKWEYIRVGVEDED